MSESQSTKANTTNANSTTGSLPSIAKKPNPMAALQQAAGGKKPQNAQTLPNINSPQQSPTKPKARGTCVPKNEE